MGRFIENLCKIQLNSNLIFYESYQHYCQTFEGNYNRINSKYVIWEYDRWKEKNPHNFPRLFARPSSDHLLSFLIPLSSSGNGGEIVSLICGGPIELDAKQLSLVVLMAQLSSPSPPPIPPLSTLLPRPLLLWPWYHKCLLLSSSILNACLQCNADISLTLTFRVELKVQSPSKLTIWVYFCTFWSSLKGSRETHKEAVWA